jgi:hypothetical protein
VATDLKIGFARGVCREAKGRLESDVVASLGGPPMKGEASCGREAARLALAGSRNGDAVEAWLDLRRDGTGQWRFSARTGQPGLAAALAAAGFAPGGEGGVLVNGGGIAWPAL